MHEDNHRDGLCSTNAAAEALMFELMELDGDAATIAALNALQPRLGHKLRTWLEELDGVPAWVAAIPVEDR